MLARKSMQSVARTRRLGTTTPMLPTTGSRITPAILSPCAANACFQLRDVVVFQHERIARRPRRNARRIRHRERRRRAARRHQQAIDVAMVVAGEFDDQIATGVTARQADRAHRRLGPRIHEPHHLDRRHRIDDPLGQFALGFRRGAEARAAPRGALRSRRRPPDGDAPGSSAPTSRCSRCSDCRRRRTGTRRSPRSMTIGLPPTPRTPAPGCSRRPALNSVPVRTADGFCRDSS